MSKVEVTELKHYIEIEGDGDQVVQVEDATPEVVYIDTGDVVNIDVQEGAPATIAVAEQSISVEVVEERVSIVEVAGGGRGESDHGELTGLADDDHLQYFNTLRHIKAVHDDLGIDADTLDGLEAAAFALSGHNHTGVYLSVLGAGDIYTHNAAEFAVSGHDHSGVYLPVAGAGDIYTHNAAEFSVSGHNHSGTYEPVLGNPAGDNYLLKSSALGARGWTDPATFATSGHAHSGVYEPAGTGHSEAAAHVTAHESAYTHSDIAANTSARHAAVTVSAPISLSGQALSLVNDAAASVTAIDTGALANSDTVIPSSKAVTTSLAEKLNITSLVLPFYKADASLDTIPLTADQKLPFFDSSAAAKNIALTA